MRPAWTLGLPREGRAARSARKTTMSPRSSPTRPKTPMQQLCLLLLRPYIPGTSTSAASERHTTATQMIPLLSRHSGLRRPHNVALAARRAPGLDHNRLQTRRRASRKAQRRKRRQQSRKLSQVLCGALEIWSQLPALGSQGDRLSVRLKQRRQCQRLRDSSRLAIKELRQLFRTNTLTT